MKDFGDVTKEEERLREALSERVELGALVGAFFILPQALRNSEWQLGA